MISPQEIEAFAVKLAVPGEVSDIPALIGHLDEPDINAVLDRAEAISRERGEADLAEARVLKSLQRLAHAAGCPSGIPVIPWLQEHGLIEEVDGGWKFKAPLPGFPVNPISA
jgi:hypothetical protein